MGIVAYIMMGLAVCNAILQILPLDNESWNCFLEGLIMVITFILELCEKRNQIPWGLYSTKKTFDAYEAGCSFTKLQLLLWFEHETPDVMHFFLENLSRQIVAFCMIRVIFILICLNWEKWPDSELGEHHETKDPGRGPTKWKIPIPEMAVEPETSVNERIRLVQPNSAVEMTALLPQKDAVTYQDESSNVESPIEGKLITMRNDPTCTEKKLTEPYSAIEMTAPTPKSPDSSIGLENPMQGNSVTVREENQLLARKPTNNGNNNGNEAEEEESTVKRPTKHVHAD